jgi:hypothetical protein
MTKQSFLNLLRDAVKAAVVTKSAHRLRKVAATAGFPRRLDRRLAGGGEAHARRTGSPAPCGKPSRTPLEQWLKKLVVGEVGLEPTKA